MPLSSYVSRLPEWPPLRLGVDCRLRCVLVLELLIINPCSFSYMGNVTTDRRPASRSSPPPFMAGDRILGHAICSLFDQWMRGFLHSRTHALHFFRVMIENAHHMPSLSASRCECMHRRKPHLDSGCTRHHRQSEPLITVRTVTVYVCMYFL